MNEAPWVTHRKIRLTGTTTADLNNNLNNLPGILGLEQTGANKWIIR